MKHTNKRAFTLVELLVVIAIIAILFVVLISKVDFATDKAKKSGVQTDFRSYQMAMHAVGIEYQGYPESLDELAEQLNKNLDRKLEVSVNGSELKSNAKDPWGTEYKLTYAKPENTRGEVTVHSAGPDMQFNTGDDLKLSSTYALTPNGPEIVVSTVGMGNFNESNSGDNPNPGGTPDNSGPTMTQSPVESITVPKDLKFVSSSDIGNFVEVRLDGETLTENVDYRKQSGSTIITLYARLIGSLENGNHTVEIESTDGIASASFAVDFPATAEPTIDLAPGLYPAGTLLAAWNGTSTTATPIQSWEDVLSSGIVALDGAWTSVRGQYEGDLVLSSDITSVSMYAWEYDCAIYGASVQFFSLDVYSSVSVFADSTFASVSMDNGASIYLSPNVQVYQPGHMTYLHSLNVHPDNEYLVYENRVLYNADKTTVYCANISGNYELPDSVTRIGAYAFSGCNWTNFDLKNVEYVGVRGLSHLSGQGISVPDGVYLDDEAFYGGYFEAITLNGTPQGANVLSCCDQLESLYLGSAWDITLAGLFNNSIPSSLTSITVEAGSIGDYAFAGAKKLQSVTLNSNVYSIGNHAFEGCEKLTSIYIPYGSFTSIGDYAFADCKALTTVTISSPNEFPSPFNKIGDYAFKNCTNLEGIDLLYQVEELGEGAFYNCYNLQNANVQNITEIKDYTFWNCFWLTSLDLSDTEVLSIGKYAFAECEQLSSLDLGNKVKTIDDYAFRNVSVSNVQIPASVTSIGSGAFHSYYSTGLTVDEANEHYKTINGVLYTKDGKTLVQYPAVKIGTSFTVPDGVEVIASSAFSSTWNLSTIVLPEGVVEIGDNAFYYSSITEIELPSTLKKIGKGAFDYCQYLTDLTIPNGVEEIGLGILSNSAVETLVTPFVGQTASTNNYLGWFFGVDDKTKNSTKVPATLKSVELTNCTSIGEYAFSGCFNLTSITIPNAVTTIGNYAFSGCEMATINLPTSLESVGDYAFNMCGGMSFTQLPSNLKTIGNYAFNYCWSISSVVIPEGVTSIGDGAFAGCWSLSTVTIPVSVTSIGNGVFDDASLNTINYTGSEAQWNNIAIGNNSVMDAATKVYNYAG